MRPLPLFFLCFCLPACLKEPDGGRVEKDDASDDTGDAWYDTGDAWYDTGDAWYDTGEEWDDTGEPEEDFPHAGEYSECELVSIVLSGKAFGAIQFCDEGMAAFTISPSGELFGEATCLSTMVGETLALSFSGEVTRSGNVEGEVAIEQLSEPFETHGEIGGGELKLSWEGWIAGNRLPFEYLQGEIQCEN